MTGRHALVVGSAARAGSEAWYIGLIAKADLVIAADGGLELCLAAGRVPDVCVGDFDSVAQSALEEARAAGAEIVRHPAAKDESDLDLAVRSARERGAVRLTLTAAFTRRIDHTLASLGTLMRSADLFGEAREPLWMAYALDAATNPQLELHEPAGTVVSVFSVGGAARVSLEGVRYPLSGHLLPPLSSHGLSNVAAAAAQRVIVHEGQALVVANDAGAGLPLS